MDADTCTDALCREALANLGQFTSWLHKYGVRGSVTEVGWSHTTDAGRWAALATQWYRAANAAKIGVFVWGVGPMAESRPVQIYTRSQSWPRGGVDQLTTSSELFQANLSIGSELRGIEVTGGSWGDGLHDSELFSNKNPGTFGKTYFYETEQTFHFLRNQGVKNIRLDIKWERLQPELNRPLLPSAVERLRATIDAAGESGLTVVIDLHNYAHYKFPGHYAGLGSAALPTSALVDFWTRFSQEFRGDKFIGAYELMNEPEGLGNATHSGELIWRTASNNVVEALRKMGDNRMVFVDGYNWAQAGSWQKFNHSPWIHDPANNTVYAAHQYFSYNEQGSLVDYEKSNSKAAELGF